MPVVVTPALLNARKAVASDLIRCGSLLTALSYVQNKGSQADLIGLNQGWMAMAMNTYNADKQFYQEEVVKSAKQVAKELVGASPEKLLALSQSCNAYTKPGGVEQAIKEKIDAAGK